MPTRLALKRRVKDLERRPATGAVDESPCILRILPREILHGFTKEEIEVIASGGYLRRSSTIVR